MKSLTKLSIALAPMMGVFASAQAAEPITLADGITMHITGQVTMRSESNVLLRESNEDSDLSFDYTPGLELNIGKSGVTDLNGVVSYRYHIIEFSDNHSLDSRNDDFKTNLVYSNANFVAKGHLSYVELQTNQDVAELTSGGLLTIEPGRVSRSIINASAYGEMSISPKTKIGTGISYVRQNYIESLGYNDVAKMVVPVDLYLAVSPKTDFIVGASYGSLMLGDSNSSDANDFNLNVGVRGELMPKLHGSARVGWMSRDGRSIEDQDGISFDADLKYDLTPLSTLTLRGMRDLSASSTSSQTTTRTGIIGYADFRLASVFQAGGNLGYIKTEYEDASGRDDDYMMAGAYVGYIPNEYVNVKLSYSYKDNDSNYNSVDYNNNVLEVVASFRY
ncbi:MAG: outer membrane beta-barrel protein [Opitutales bacterium]|nr:outer membrane beta-barrel protein [Opitutales bacterium]